MFVVSLSSFPVPWARKIILLQLWTPFIFLITFVLFNEWELFFKIIKIQLKMFWLNLSKTRINFLRKSFGIPVSFKKLEYFCYNFSSFENSYEKKAGASSFMKIKTSLLTSPAASLSNLKCCNWQSLNQFFCLFVCFLVQFKVGWMDVWTTFSKVDS